MTTTLADLTIIYVLDPPALTLDSTILLSSIRYTLGDDVNVVAYVPEAKRAFILPYIEEFYAHMNADIRVMPALDQFVAPYKQGNKIQACCQARDTPYTLFLDTDTIIASRFEIDDLFKPHSVSVAPEGVQTWGGNEGEWDYVYEKFGLPLPEERVQLARSHRMVLPYFNAGMIAFPTQSDFSSSWMDVASAIDHDANVQFKRPWLDQIALPLAIKKAGLENNIMDRAWNLSISHPKYEKHFAGFFEDVNGVDAKIVHFHRPQFFRGTKYLAHIDAAISAMTNYKDLTELTAQQELQQAHRAAVWTRFGVIKDKPDKTPEDLAELHELRQEKNSLKAFEYDIDRQKDIAPTTIVKLH